mmetsp:Transcript_34013/g.76345  ORF Transcript_34013/g.76345 Transcript_34013/m.76345 type:complete len:299 (+) Transcript_34013:678-1574(+)
MPFDGSESLVDKAQSFSQRKGQSVIRVVLQPQLHANIDDFRGGALFAVLIALEDDGDDQVHDHHRDEQCVRHPEAVGEVRTLSTAVGMLDETLVLKHLELREGVEQVRGRTPVTLLVKLHLTHGEVVHDLVPRLTRGSTEEGNEREDEVLKVRMNVKRPTKLRCREKAYSQNAIQNEEQEKDQKHVHELRQGHQKRHEDLVQALQKAKETEKSGDSKDADDLNDGVDTDVGSPAHNNSNDGRDNAHEVEAVPAITPVVGSQGKELQHTLDGEDGRKDVIHCLQERLPLREGCWRDLGS